MLRNINNLVEAFQLWQEGKEYQGNEGDLAVWHIPQVPMKAFIVPVSSPEEALWVLNILACYDIFQFEENVKPNYSNASGLNVFEDGEWVTWYDEDGNDIGEIAFNSEGKLVPEWTIEE